MMVFGVLTSTLMVNGSLLTVAPAYHERLILKFEGHLRTATSNLIMFVKRKGSV